MADNVRELFHSSLESIKGWSEGDADRAQTLKMRWKSLKRRIYYWLNPRALKVEKLVAKVASLGLVKDQYLALAPPEYALGAIFIGGGINTTIIYNVFDDSKFRGINNFVQVKMHVMLPNRVEFEARQTVKEGVKLEQPIQTQVYDDYKRPGLFLLDSLSEYFPGFPVAQRNEEASA
jgi:hypothetical protein